MKHTLDCLYRLISPMHISSPDGGFYANPEEGAFINTTGDGFPMTRTVRLPLNSQGVDEEKKRGGYVPVLPGGGLKGRLRRFASDIIIGELLAARKETVSFEVYHAMRSGSPSGIPDGEQLSLTNAHAAAVHPFTGVYGGGRKFTRGSLSEGIGWPITQLTLDAQLVPVSFQEHASSRDGAFGNYDTNGLTYNFYFTRKDDLKVFTPQSLSQITDAPVGIKKWLDMLEASQENKKKTAAQPKGTKMTEEEKKANKKIGLATVAATEVIVPGTMIHARSFYDDGMAGMAGLGLLLLSLGKFAQCGQHGGKSAVGFGRFVLTVQLDGKPALTLAPNGEFEPDLAHPTVEAALDAWSAYAPSITAANMTTLMLGE